MQKDFYINDQFLVKPGANLLIDGLISKISKVDPGVMRLLCLLAEHNGKMVLNAELQITTWPDGSGSEEKLDHTITIIRRMLQDDRKNMIRQIARKGYLFQAAVTNADIDDLTREAAADPGAQTPATATQKWIVILSILIIVLLILFVLFNYTYSNGTPGQSPVNTITAPDIQSLVPGNENNTVPNPAA